MSKEELYNITGGGVSAAMINSIVRGILSLCELGRSFGSSIRRSISGNICPLK